jgi:hypothetical protein
LIRDIDSLKDAGVLRILILRLLLAPWFVLLSALVPLRAQGFTVEAHGGVPATTVPAVERMVSNGLRELLPAFPGIERRPFSVHVHESADALPPELARSLDAGTAGFALLERDEMHLLLSKSTHSGELGLAGVVKHELVHLLLDQYAGAAGPYVPRWFHEGLAQCLAGETYLMANEESLVFRAATGTLMSFYSLVDGFPRRDETALQLAYGQSWSFVAFLQRRIGMRVLLRAARECGPKLGFQHVIARDAEIGLYDLDQQWQRYLIHESGAPWRVLMRNTFECSMLVAVPILILAIRRRRRREGAIADRLARADDEVDSVALAGGQAGASASEP